ncbi:MAG: DUF4301 family protein [Oligoflexus sp.]
MENMTRTELEEFGLDPDTIFLHQKRILSFLADQTQSALPVRDTCRIDNGGITPFNKIQALVDRIGSGNELHSVVAFVPAAGAASRYFQPLMPLMEALQQKDEDGINQAITALKSAGAEGWALPPALKEAVIAKQSVSVALEKREQILEEINLAKALQPAVPSGESFLQLKNLEHSLMQGISGQVYIVPADQSGKFAEILQKSDPLNKLPSFFLEQGPKLSTIRFQPDGSPYRDEAGQLSPVPAGHGTLIHLIPEVKKLIPESQTIFIRNIDNVMGSRKEALTATVSFLKAHQWLLDQVQTMRRHLQEASLQAGHDAANQVLEIYGSPLVKEKDLLDFLQDIPPAERPYWQVLINVFHCSRHFARQEIASADSSLQALKKLMQRPVNSLGQVPNSGKDVGGTPVFTESSGLPLTICLEVPHASEEDKQKFLSNPEKATHFNPVFVASEITSPAAYERERSPFWILAKKTIGSSSVVYHETVLYELLGNSILANVVFPEIPRLLFHPHKSLSDSYGRCREDWVKPE